MIQQALHQVINRNDLDFETAKNVMREIMTGEATHVQVAAYLTALRMKGESIEEITASAQVMREMAFKINPPFPVMDIVGTGGDEAGTFNVSTTSAFVIAGAGVPVAKHGNRSVSSKSGSADVLEALGIHIDIPYQSNEEILKRTNMCFLFAQKHHSAMKNVALVRAEMKERTLFNILGPLANPAQASMQLLGVYDKNLVEPLASVLKNLGVTRGLVVCGSDGLDEITMTGKTHVCEIRFGKIVKYDITPGYFGFQTCELSDLTGGNPLVNAEITKGILKGTDRSAKRDVVILNSALAIYLGTDKTTMEDCIIIANETIDSGKAYRKLEEFRNVNNEIYEAEGTA